MRANILVVDDDISIGAAIADYLQHVGFVVRTAPNADAAIGILQAADPPIDLVFSDINMPGRMDGRALRQFVAQHWPQIPVFLTSGGDPGVVDGHFFQKPYRPSHVAQAIQAALSKQG